VVNVVLPVRNGSLTWRQEVVYRLAAVIILCTYSAFRLECFDDEYEQNHPQHDFTTTSFSRPSLTWETFDKDNATKAFVFDASIRLHLLFKSVDRYVIPRIPPRPYNPVRDKSPPLEFGEIIPFAWMMPS
jgi:hypothetical protein